MPGSPAESSRAERIARWRQIHAEARMEVIVRGATPEQNTRAEGALSGCWKKWGVSPLEAADAAIALEGGETPGCFRLAAMGPEASSDTERDLSARCSMDRERKALSAWESAHALAWAVAMGSEYPGTGVTLAPRYDRDAFDAACDALWPHPAAPDDYDYPERGDAARYETIMADWVEGDADGTPHDQHAAQ